MDTFGQWLWMMVWFFLFLFYLVILFQIIGDLFRDRELSGWWKALWVIALVVAPYLSAFVYLIARGRGMAERQRGALVEAKHETDTYIRSVAAQLTGGADRRREGPAGLRGDRRRRVRDAQGQGARLTTRRPTLTLERGPPTVRVTCCTDVQDAWTLVLERPSVEGAGPPTDG